MNYQQVKWITLLVCIGGISLCFYWAGFCNHHPNSCIIGFIFEYIFACKILCGADKPDPNHKSFFKELKGVLSK